MIAAFFYSKCLAGFGDHAGIRHPEFFRGHFFGISPDFLAEPV